jgi:hypothetical protein
MISRSRSGALVPARIFVVANSAKAATAARAIADGTNDTVQANTDTAGMR